MIIRPVTHNDLDALFQIATESGPGFTSLRPDKKALAKKIANSCASFERRVSAPGDEHYLFVLEDDTSGEVMGTTAIRAYAGATVPLHHFRRNRVTHYSRDLNLHRTGETLTRCHHYTGCSEICSLYLRPAFRRANAGTLLSKVRFLFMALHPERFSRTVIAQMRGISSPTGQSPFWEWLKTHFVDLEFDRVTDLAGSGQIRWIDELMPSHPLYTCLMSQDARAVIGQVHPETRPALRILEAEGFQHKGLVDLFDAGPTVECKLADIHSVRASCAGKVRLARACNPATGAGYTAHNALSRAGYGTNQPVLIANTSTTNFRATLSPDGRCAEPSGDGIINIATDIVEKLHLEEGSPACLLPLKKPVSAPFFTKATELRYAH